MPQASPPLAAPPPAGFFSRFASFHRFGLRHPFVYYTFPLLAVALGIAAGSLAPPDTLPDLITSVSDKILHASAYTLFGLLLLRGWTREEAPTLPQFVWCAVIATAFGFYIEILQSFTSERTFDLTDVLANSVGIAVGLGLWLARHGMRFAPTPRLTTAAPAAAQH